MLQFCDDKREVHVDKVQQFLPKTLNFLVATASLSLNNKFFDR